MIRLELPEVTLCAATSVNIAATIAALSRSLDRVAFGDAILFTDASCVPHDCRIRCVRVAPMLCAADYSRFMLDHLAGHIITSHCLVVQWDGFVIDAKEWDPRFLDFDYIGSVWPQFHEHKVGNGGFSLRSRKLLQALSDPEFFGGHPEDLAICRDRRLWLEKKHRIRFADPAIAARFAFERERAPGPTFGFHGVFNLPAAVGMDLFWEIYLNVDHREAVFHDFWQLLAGLIRAPRGRVRAFCFLRDYLRYRLSAWVHR